ncbi:hypothetical protein WA556_007152 [Blastocystis sp. ATCC 50177/Nand II]
MVKKGAASVDSVVKSVDGFYIYPMQLSDHMGTRFIYCKEDTIASGETKDRLLMINVGDVTEEYLRKVFSRFGDIESIEFGRLAKGGARVAYLKYSERKSLQAALRDLKNNPESIPSPSFPKPASCLSQYHEEIKSQYSTSRLDLRREAEKALTQYKEEQDSIKNETDEDGWTVVRRRSRMEEETMLSAIQLREKRRHEMMQKKDFYKQGCCAPMRSRFQGRENKRDQLKELREQ